MKREIKEGSYDTLIETSDWRFTATVLGLVKYFKFLSSIGEKVDYYIEDDGDAIKYKQEDITLERYLRFVEAYFKSEMHHIVVENIVKKEKIDEEDIKLVNEKLKVNTVMKSVFKGITCSEDTKEEILRLIDHNRMLLIEKTFKNGKKLYDNFNISTDLLSEKGKVCRIKNYYVDMNRKSKSMAYQWNIDTYKYEDEKEFDFIPFAFSKPTRFGEVFFINNNFSIRQLEQTNNIIQGSENTRSALFQKIKESAGFIDYDVEVIIKKVGTDYYETLFIRKKAIKILEKIKNYGDIQFYYALNDNYGIKFEEEVTNRILNLIRLDDLIELLLKSKKTSMYRYRLRTLIEINTMIYGGEKMDEKMKGAYAAAKKVVEKIPENKVNSYKQKLISAITFRDKERVCEILLQLSSYSGVVFNFAYDVFGDFDNNKNLLYTFVNALNKDVKDGGNKNE